MWREGAVLKILKKFPVEEGRETGGLSRVEARIGRLGKAGAKHQIVREI